MSRSELEFAPVSLDDVLRLRENAVDAFIGRVYDDPVDISAGIWHGKQLLGAFGTTSRWPGVADLWGVVRQGADSHALSFVRRCQWLVNHHARVYRLRRVAAWVIADHERCTRFARLCGFHCEYIDSSSGPRGEDLALFVRRWRWT